MDTDQMAVVEAARVSDVNKCGSETQRTACMGEDEVNAVCVDFIDIGQQETPWGVKPQCKYVFETDRVKESGYPINVTRTFTNSLHEKAAMRAFIRDWRGEDLAPEEIARFKRDKMVGKPCRLTVQDTISKNGFPYLKAVAIAPAGEKKLKPSGTYRRFDPANN